MKHGLLMLLALGACTTAPQSTDPGQNLVNVTGDSCQKITAAIKAADAAVLQGVLKGQDAQNVVKALSASQAGCHSALATILAAQPAASAASGVTP